MQPRIFPNPETPAVWWEEPGGAELGPSHPGLGWRTTSLQKTPPPRPGHRRSRPVASPHHPDPHRKAPTGGSSHRSADSRHPCPIQSGFQLSYYHLISRRWLPAQEGSVLLPSAGHLPKRWDLLSPKNLWVGGRKGRGGHGSGEVGGRGADRKGGDRRRKGGRG